jgi:hypothetical protein
VPFAVWLQVQEVYVPSDNLTLMTSDHRPVVGQFKLKDD